MSTHITRLRRQTQPVQEDTPVPPREHRISVDRRDLLQLLADYDAATKNELLMQMLSHAWEFQAKFHADNTVREIKIVIKDTCTMSPQNIDRMAQLMREFVEHAPGALQS